MNMKKNLFGSFLAVLAILLTTSCTQWFNFEEHLSVTSEEEAELIQGKWELVRAGSSLFLENEVEYVDTDEPPLVSAIESLEIINDEDGFPIFNFTFKEETKITHITFIDERRRETYTWHTAYSVIPSECWMWLGFEDGEEYFYSHEGEDVGGGVRCWFNLYGIDRGNTYTVKRMILCGGTPSSITYYEFKPL